MSQFHFETTNDGKNVMCQLFSDNHHEVLTLVMIPEEASSFMKLLKSNPHDLGVYVNGFTISPLHTPRSVVIHVNDDGPFSYLQIVLLPDQVEDLIATISLNLLDIQMNSTGPQTGRNLDDILPKPWSPERDKEILDDEET